MTKSVLVVDDELDVREILVDLLSDSGYSVSSASNGQEAMTLLKSNPDTGVVLLDLNMPVCNGIQFRKNQMEDVYVSSVPVVFLSAESNISVVANDLKVDGYIRKPVDLRILMTLVQKFCG